MLTDSAFFKEIFNSPYAVTAFRKYSESIPNHLPSKAESLESESTQALSRMAKENGIWLIGGELLG